MKAAALLTPLPAMDPSLTHMPVSEQPRLHCDQMDPCVEWNAAVQAVRVEVGPTWCESMNDVMAWREDVALRRSVGFTAQIWLPCWH